MKPTRSLLFVPGHRKGWAEKAVAAGADAIILDLEDSVPPGHEGRDAAYGGGDHPRLAKNHPQVSIYVRLNALETGLMGDDLGAVAIDGCDGFLPPKTYGARDVIRSEALVDSFRAASNGVAAGKLEFVLSLETAQAYADCENDDQGLAPLRNPVRRHGAGRGRVALGRLRVHAGRVWRRSICEAALCWRRARPERISRSSAYGRTSRTSTAPGPSPVRTVNWASAEWWRSILRTWRSPMRSFSPSPRKSCSIKA